MLFAAIAAVDDIVARLTNYVTRGLYILTEQTMVLPVVNVSHKLTMITTHQTRPAFPSALSHWATSHHTHLEIIDLALSSDPRIFKRAV